MQLYAGLSPLLLSPQLAALAGEDAWLGLDCASAADAAALLAALRAHTPSAADVAAERAADAGLGTNTAVTISPGPSAVRR